MRARAWRRAAAGMAPRIRSNRQLSRGGRASGGVQRAGRWLSPPPLSRTSAGSDRPSLRPSSGWRRTHGATCRHSFELSRETCCGRPSSPHFRASARAALSSTPSAAAPDAFFAYSAIKQSAIGDEEAAARATGRHVGRLRSPSRRATAACSAGYAAPSRPQSATVRVRAPPRPPPRPSSRAYRQSSWPVAGHGPDGARAGAARQPGVRWRRRYPRSGSIRHGGHS